jgi:hypothetical protein
MVTAITVNVFLRKKTGGLWRIGVMSLKDLDQRFFSLGSWLQEFRSLWEPRPFVEYPAPWEAEHPQLAQELRGLSLTQIILYEKNPETFRSKIPLFEQLAKSSTILSQCPNLEDTGTLTVNVKKPANRRGIPGKKWTQIQAFSQASSAAIQSSPGSAIFDWCGGKGHLGRSLAFEHGKGLTLLDHDATLCTAGEALAKTAGLCCHTHCLDALSPSAGQHLNQDHVALALHACGQLNMELIKHSAGQSCPTLIVVPCCYHRIKGQDYQALSQAAQSQQLLLNREQLKLATTEQITTSKKASDTRHNWMIWRTGFDLLLRQASGLDRYTPLPHFPSSRSKLGFEPFCRWLAEEFDKELPATWDNDKVLAEATTRVRQMRGLGILRWLFRRPLELYLCLDRALFLQEQDYEVKLGQFCNREVTPRNLMIVGQRS